MRRPDAFASMAQEGMDGLMVLASTFTFSRRTLLADLEIRHRLPTVFGNADNVQVPGAS